MDTGPRAPPRKDSLLPDRVAVRRLERTYLEGKNTFRLARIYDRLGDTDRARHWYERFTEDWKVADPDIPELIEAREKLGELAASATSSKKDSDPSVAR